MWKFIKRLFGYGYMPHAVDKSMTVFPLGTDESVYQEVLTEYTNELESRIETIKGDIRWHSKKEAYESLRLHVITEVLNKLKGVNNAD